MATAVLYLAKEILIPIALAVLISFLLFPLVLWLERRRVKRVIAVILTVLTIMGFVGSLGYLLAGQFIEFVDNLPSYRKNIVAKIHTIKPGKESVFKRAEAAFADISREVESAGTTTTVQSTGQTTGTTTTVTTASVPVPAEVLGLRAEDETDLKGPREEAFAEVVAGHIDEDVEDTRQGLEVIAEAQTGQVPGTSDAVPVKVVEGPPNSWQTFQDIVGPLFTILGNAGLVVLFVIFFLLQREDLRDRMIRLAGQNKVRVTTEALEEAANRVSRYLLMQFIVNATYGIPVALGLWLIGVPNAILWGAMATILRFIPYVGPWFAAIMPIMLSLAVFDNWTMPLLTIGLFVLLEIISNNFMEPVLYGHTTGVSPVAIIVAAVFWTWLWGAVGLVLATPITVCLVVLGRHIPQLAFLRVLLGDEPVLSDDARIYNRLLSGAADEAVDIAEEYAEEHGINALYDKVLLPALESAETDRSDELLSVKRYEKLISGMNELLDAVADKAAKAEDEENQERIDSEGENVNSISTPLPMRKITCIPVNDATDETAAHMLRHLLEKRDCFVDVLRPGMLVSEILDAVREFGSESIVLSSVPPFAVTHTRYLAKRVDAEFPDKKLCVGLWRPGDTPEKADVRLKQVGVEHIFTSLSEAALRV